MWNAFARRHRIRDSDMSGTTDPSLAATLDESHGRTILILRHGETDYKKEGRYQGSSPLPRLTEAGRRQAEEFLTYLGGVKFDRVISGTLPRATETLDLLLQAFPGAPRVSSDPRLNEVGIREWEGRLKSAIAVDARAALESWRIAPHLFVDCEGGRPLVELYERVGLLASELRAATGLSLVIGHDHADRALITTLMGLSVAAHALFPQDLLGLSILHAEPHQHRFQLRVSNLQSRGGRTVKFLATEHPRLILIRHGITSGNRERIYQGSVSNPGLEGKGVSQIEALGDLLQDVEAACVYSSDLRRARESAELLPVPMNVPRIADERLNEFHYGHWTGLRQDDVARRYPEEVAAFQRGGLDRPIRDAEPLSALFHRVGEFLNETWSRLGRGQTAIVVAHDVVIRSAITLALGLPASDFWQFPVENGAASELVRWRRSQTRLTMHNVLPGGLEDRHDHEYF